MNCFIFGLMCSYLFGPSDVLSAGVALGHAGEWEAMRDYLKSSYKASQLGQVSAVFHLMHRVHHR